MLIECIRILTTHRPDTLRGFAERTARAYYEKRGYVVWRGGFINANRRERYPNIARKYERLERIMRIHYPATFEHVCYLCAQSGMPDLLVWNGRNLRFIEVKLDYEPLAEHQSRCIMRLVSLGFDVRIMRIVSKATRRRRSTLDLASGEETEHERQMRLRAFMNH